MTVTCNLVGTDSVGRQARWCPLRVCPHPNVEPMQQVGFRAGILQHLKERFKPKSALVGPLAAVSGHLTSEFVTAVHSTCTSFLKHQTVTSVIVETEHKVRNFLIIISFQFQSTTWPLNYFGKINNLLEAFQSCDLSFHCCAISPYLLNRTRKIWARNAR